MIDWLMMVVVRGLFDPVAVRGEVLMMAVVLVWSSVHLDLHSTVMVCNHVLKKYIPHQGITVLFRKQRFKKVENF